MNNKTAILFFSEGVAADASRKQLAHNKQLGTNKLVLRQLSRHALQVAGSTGLPVFSSDFLITNRSTFGKDLRRAVESVFEKGFQKVICIGNDCPGLDKNIILQASVLLQSNQSVVGPDARGGVYLLGISKDGFDAAAFETLAWKTPRMLASYLQTNDDQAAVLPQLADVHTFQELQNYATARSFIGFLLTIGHTFLRQGAHQLSSFYSRYSVAFAALRGPPALG